MKTYYFEHSYNVNSKSEFDTFFKKSLKDFMKELNDHTVVSQNKIKKILNLSHNYIFSDPYRLINHVKSRYIQLPLIFELIEHQNDEKTLQITYKGDNNTSSISLNLNNQGVVKNKEVALNVKSLDDYLYVNGHFLEYLNNWNYLLARNGSVKINEKNLVVDLYQKKPAYGTNETLSVENTQFTIKASSLYHEVTDIINPSQNIVNTHNVRSYNQSLNEWEISSISKILFRTGTNYYYSLKSNAEDRYMDLNNYQIFKKNDNTINEAFKNNKTIFFSFFSCLDENDKPSFICDLGDITFDLKTGKILSIAKQNISDTETYLQTLNNEYLDFLSICFDLNINDGIKQELKLVNNFYNDISNNIKIDINKYNVSVKLEESILEKALKKIIIEKINTKKNFKINHK